MRFLWFISLLLCLGLTAPAAIYQLPGARTNDWTLAGVSNGIPTYASGLTVTASPFNAAGDGVTDDWGAIDSAITNSTDYTTINMPAGTYRITKDLLLGIGHGARYDKHISLKGAGSRSTTLLLDYNGGQAGIYARGSAPVSQQSLLSGYTKGSKTVTTTVTPVGLTNGNFIAIGQTLETEFWVGDIPTSTSDFDYQINQIKSISGNDITLEQEIMRDFTNSRSPYIERIALQTGLGVEDLMIRLAPGKTADRGIFFWRTADSWVRNVIVTNYGTHGISLTTCFRDTLERADVGYTGAKTSSSYGIQLGNQATANLICDSIWVGQPTGLIIQNGSWGNVIAYNYFVRGFTTSSDAWGIGGHGGATLMNLIEGNVTDEVRLDEVWGANHYNLFFRNFCSRIEPVLGPRLWPDNAYGLRCDATNYFNSFINNVVWESSYNTNSAEVYGYSPDASYNGDPGVTNTLIRHGNFLAYANATVYTDSAHSFVDSYAFTSKPIWFSNVAWPIIGSDVNTSLISSNPAVLRAAGIDYHIASGIGSSQRVKFRGLRIHP